MNVRFPWLLFSLAGLYILWSHLPPKLSERLAETFFTIPAYGDNAPLHLAKIAMFLLVIVAVIKLLTTKRSDDR